VPAIPHVIRRGAVYYWRRRLPAALAQTRKSATLILGLRTSDSRRARFLASQVTALVDLHFLPAVMNQRLNQKQIQTIFRDVFTRHLDKLEAVAARERMDPAFDAEDSRRSDRVTGWAYRLLETRGGGASVDFRAREAMLADGMDEADVAEVGAMLAIMQRQNLTAERPERLKAAIEMAGGEPNPLNFALAQEAIHRAMAEANFATAQRYDGARVESAPLVADILTRRAVEYSRGGGASDAAGNDAGLDSGREIQGTPSPPMQFSQPPQATGATSVDDRATSDRKHEVNAAPAGAAADRSAQVHSAPPADTKPMSLALHPIVVFGEKLIAQNEANGSWDTKTQNQARQIYRLFGKLLLELSLIEPAALEQSHFAQLVDLLAEVATSYGKSSKDDVRTTAELRAIGAGKPPAQRGIKAETLNRHLTFLGQLLVFIKGRGVKLDRDIDLSLLRGKTRNTRGRTKRALFSGAELAAIFRLACFVGCLGWKDEEAFTAGPQIFHRGLYFAIILLYYTGARREEICGLMVDDVACPELDLNGETRRLHSIFIRVNDERRVKNEQSIRLVALLPEVVRLGFLDYVDEIRALGYKLVFPDLKSPTSQSPMGDRLYDEFKRGLDRAVPDASTRKKVLHSFRKTFGDSLKQAGVVAEIRGDILGHGGETVTEEIYCDPIALAAMLEHMSKLPIVTAHLEPRPISLIPWVQQKLKPPFSRKSRAKQSSPAPVHKS
jgi:integrase